MFTTRANWRKLIKHSITDVENTVIDTAVILLASQVKTTYDMVEDLRHFHAVVDSENSQF